MRKKYWKKDPRPPEVNYGFPLGRANTGLLSRANMIAEVGAFTLSLGMVAQVDAVILFPVDMFTAGVYPIDMVHFGVIMEVSSLYLPETEIFVLHAPPPCVIEDIPQGHQ